MASVTPMKHHGPGWTIEPGDGWLYQLWAPRPDETIVGHDGSTFERAGRDSYAAACTAPEGYYDSLYRSGLDTLEAALALFPTRIAREFQEAAS